MTRPAGITVSHDETSTTVSGAGEMDLTNATEFSEALDEAMSGGGKVIVDLREAVFIDTAILACLARCGKMLLDAGDRLTVTVVSGSHPEYVLKTVGFAEMMDIEIVQKSTA
jgi:anti-anti-sigma factor